jgi:CRP/FNR family transcriptional regulator, cyclic AMP receptor protein
MMSEPARFDPRILARLKSLSWLSPAQIERLAEKIELYRFRPHRVIMPTKTMPPEDLYIVLSGATRAARINRLGARVLIEIQEPGHVFGGLPFTRDIRSSDFYIEALSNCVLGKFDTPTFLEITLGSPVPNFGHVFSLMTSGVWTAFVRYTNFIGERMRHRLAEELLQLGAKFGARDARGTILNVRVTRSDLADLIGASRQLVTELLRDFELCGAIERDRHRLILRSAELEKIAASQLVRKSAARPEPNITVRPRRPVAPSGRI